MTIQSLLETIETPNGTMHMTSAWATDGRAVVNLTTLPDGVVTAVVGVHGRGSLQMTFAEFSELTDVIMEMERVQLGGEPTSVEVVSQ